MKKMLAALLCLLTLFTGAALRENRAFAQSSFGSAVIDAGDSNRIHLRQQPSTDASSLGLYFTGTLVQCLSDPSAQWTYVSIGSQAGYMMSRYLRSDAAVDSRQPLGLAHSSTGSRVNVRSAPTTEADLLWSAEENDAFTVLGETVNGWYCVQSGDSVGYIRSDLLTITDRIAQGAVTLLPAAGANPPTSTPEPPSGDDLSAYRAVLRGEVPVLTNDYGQAYVTGWPALPGGEEITFARFAVADLDGDSKREIILEQVLSGQNYAYGFVVLHVENGAIYGYELVYRALENLKTDGTFSASSGAADNGFGRLGMDGPTCFVVLQTYSESSYAADGSMNIRYVVDFIPAQEAAFTAAIAIQDTKPEAVWYEPTDANIAAILGS